MFLSIKNCDRGKLFDADGTEIVFAIDADTETGRVTEFISESLDGGAKTIKIFTGGDWSGSYPGQSTRKATYKAPLRFERFQRDAPNPLCIGDDGRLQ